MIKIIKGRWQFGCMEVFFEEAMGLTGIQASEHTVLMRIWVMSNAELETDRKV